MSSTGAPEAGQMPVLAPPALATTASSVCARCRTTSLTDHPPAPDAAAHCRSSRPERMPSSLSCSASRSSKITMPGLCHGGERRAPASLWVADIGDEPLDERRLGVEQGEPVLLLHEEQPGHPLAQ